MILESTEMISETYGKLYIPLLTQAPGTSELQCATVITGENGTEIVFQNSVIRRVRTHAHTYTHTHSLCVSLTKVHGDDLGVHGDDI